MEQRSIARNHLCCPRESSTDAGYVKGMSEVVLQFLSQEQLEVLLKASKKGL